MNDKFKGNQPRSNQLRSNQLRNNQLRNNQLSLFDNKKDLNKKLASKTPIEKTPIEIALGVDESGDTTARKLYEFLELDLSNYAKWVKSHITENPFAVENVDFTPLVLNDECLKVSGNFAKDYKLTAPFAKKLSMTSKSEKGEAARNYFIAVEDKLKTIVQTAQTPASYIEALQALIESEKAKEALRITARKYEAQADTDGLYKVGEISKEFGVSAIELNRFLHSHRVIYRPSGSDTWQLYTEYAKDNIAITKLVKLDNGFDRPMLLWTPKGRDFIFDLVEEKLPKWYI